MGGSRGRVLFFYALLIGGAVAAFTAVCAAGESLAGSAAVNVVAAKAAGPAKVNALLHILIALLVILVVARALGALVRLLGQPAVIGEVIAGIVLGPSVLGAMAPEAMAFVLPATVAPFLSILSQVGVILFMFTVGIELDTTVLRHRAHAAVSVSHASIVVPFVLGGTLALFLYPRFGSQSVPFSAFALFIGIAMSVTAFPVLARILTDRGLSTSKLGVVSLTCAAVDDVTAWCLLAFVVSFVKADGGGGVVIALKSMAYLAVMFAVVRPVIARLARAQEAKVTQDGVAVMLALLLGSSLATEWIGIHALFGAFLVGALVPHDSKLAHALMDKLRDLVVVFLLPAFFAFTGLRTQIALIGGGYEWMICGLIIVVASAGKFGGSAIAGRVTGMAWRDAAQLGILMNTRGLMELIVLNIGYDLGVISPTLFAMLVIMALVTTAATTPILDRLTRVRTAEPVLAVA